MKFPLRIVAVTAALLLLSLASFPLSATAQNNVPRMVFFDVFVSEELPDLRKSAALLTRAMSAELAALPEVQMLDQGTRDTLLLQRKFKLEDCSKAECRFAMAKALPGVDYMLEAEVEPFGKQCTLSMRVKEVRKGTIASSLFETMACDPEAVLASLQSISGRIWPPGTKTKANRSADSGARREAPQAVATDGVTRLVLTTEPSASIFINGSRVGSGRLEREVQAGEYQVRIVARDYTPQEFTLNVSEGESIRRTVTLERGPKQWWATIGAEGLFALSRAYVPQEESVGDFELDRGDLDGFGIGGRLEFGRSAFSGALWGRYAEYRYAGYSYDDDTATPMAWLDSFQMGLRPTYNWFPGSLRVYVGPELGMEFGSSRMDLDDDGAVDNGHLEADHSFLLYGGTVGVAWQRYAVFGLELTALAATGGDGLVESASPQVHLVSTLAFEPTAFFD